MFVQADRTEELRGRILEVAEERFRQYGYTKTTMAEIAEDVDMSAANLYRYFRNKQDIAAACADRCMGERITLLREVARRPGLSAAVRLETFVLEMVQHTFEQATNQPKINELVETIARERQDIVHQKNKALQGLIAEILAQGNETGEFEVDDVLTAAHAVYAATAMFGVPIFMSLYTLAEFQSSARAVVEILIRGLRKA